MKLEQVQRIKEIIDRAEIEKAKAEGAIESIKKKWKETFGTDDINQVEIELEKLMKEKERLEARIKSIKDELVSAYDWESIADELGMVL